MENDEGSAKESDERVAMFDNTREDEKWATSQLEDAHSKNKCA